MTAPRARFLFAKVWEMYYHTHARPHRLTVRTAPFHGANRGSIPREVTTAYNPHASSVGILGVAGPTLGIERRRRYTRRLEGVLVAESGQEPLSIFERAARGKYLVS